MQQRFKPKHFRPLTAWLAAILIALLLAAPVRAAIDNTSFAPKVDFTTANIPYSVVIGDLDGDGKRDIAVANGGSRSVSVYLNTSTSGSLTSASFAPKVDFTVGSLPQGVAIGDLDGDGKLDLVTANHGTNNVSVLQNTSTSGSVSFATKVDFATAINPYSVAIGDLDGDGKLDLATANFNSASVSMLRNTSTSGSSVSFATKVDFTVGINPNSVAIGDLDGDGKLDLATANINSFNVSVLRNTSTSVGSVSFDTKVDFAIASDPYGVAIGDLDGDGKLDLATAGGGGISVLRNTSTNGNVSFAPKVGFGGGQLPINITIGDLDGDDKLDLAMANLNGNGVSVLRNTSGSSVSFAPVVLFATGIEPRGVAIGDLDGDGKLDLAAANGGSTTVSVLRNTIISPEIDVRGNNLAIVSGDSTPALADHSDFGNVNISGGTVVRTFTINNTGNDALSLSNPTLTGANAANFAVSSAPASSVAAGASTTFQLTFDPSAAGTRVATVTIVNNDSNEGSYTFAIQGTGTLPTPNLNIPPNQISAANGSFNVPVNFTSDGASIASVGFSLNYDPICLSFDAAHSGRSASLSNAFAADISHATPGQLELSLFDDVGPITTLTDGPLFNLAFTVNDSCITTDGSLRNVAFSFASTPAVSFGDAASVDVVGTATGATIPLHFNATPTALNLSHSSVDENAASGTAVGTLSTSDPDGLADSHTYTLLSVDGNGANPGFVLDGTNLKTTAVFDFETKSSYVVRIRTTDNGGLNGTLEHDFTVNVNDLVEAPASITPTDGANSDGNPNTVDLNENVAAGAIVATLSPSNPDATNSYTYEFVGGAGSTDNVSFTLVGNILKANASLDYETKPSYTVRVRITDSHGNMVDQIIVITVNNVNDAPVAVDDAPSTILLGGTTTTLDVLSNDSDQDHNPFSVSALTQPATGSVTNNGSNVSFSAPNSNGSTSFTYQASDGLLSSNSASVNLSYVKNDPRGDCNSNGSVTAADFIATVLEIFDSSDTQVSSNPAWWLIYTGAYPGSPLGCDANASKNGDDHTIDSVGAGDITCTVLLFFGRTCGTNLVSAASTPAQLTVADAIATPGEHATVKVNFTPAGNSVAAATFALTVDATQLGFDATDANGDGVPDAVVLNVPASMSQSVTWNAAQSRLEVAVFGTALPLPSLTDGTLATVTFQVAATASGASALELQLVTLGDPEGQDLTVNASHGTLTVTGDAATLHKFLYLPIVIR